VCGFRLVACGMRSSRFYAERKGTEPPPQPLTPDSD
jgi:hypothetical protein